MVTNEVFIDSATLREECEISLENIGYVPRSRTSSVTAMSFSVDVSNATAVTLTLETDLLLLIQSLLERTLIFYIPNDITVPVDSTGLSFRGIQFMKEPLLKKPSPLTQETPTKDLFLETVELTLNS